MYNQIVRTIALKIGLTNLADLARLFALANVAMADAGIAGWEAKYHYQFWRPVTGIRAGDTDNNSTTHKEAKWYPLGAPATNTRGPNFTPPFPAYPSGHATFGGALFQIFRKFLPDHTKFTFVSDEFNGINLDNSGKPSHFVRSRSTRSARRSSIMRKAAYSWESIGRSTPMPA
jgi:membrane-associated phospholipid phosphatase